MTTQEKKQELFEMLQKAFELEFTTIPPYLLAALSLHPNSNRKSFSIIHSVYMEEMLHMILAANTLNAIGGKVSLKKENIPSFPLTIDFKGKQFRNREFEISLERFSKQSIYTFMQIELPDYWPELKAPKVKSVEIPGYTIGEFYDSIKTKLTDLCNDIGEEELFNGNPDLQISIDFYWSGGGKPVTVKNLKDAMEALDVIIDQGEGASVKSVEDNDNEFFGEKNEVAHYFRFNEIYVGRKYKPNDNPLKPPTGEIFAVDFSSVYPIKANCKSEDFNDTPKLGELNTEFNTHYTLMLQKMENAFNGNPKELYSAIMNDMHQMAKIAVEMAQIPIVNNPNKCTGAPSFEWVELAI
jgi:hypothetical protein